MQTVIDQFRLEIVRVRNLDAIYKILKIQTTVALELDDILRAELVMVVSALDLYIHEVTRIGMLDAYSNIRKRTSSLLKFQITLENVFSGISTHPDTNWLDIQIRTNHSYKSFQDPDKIADAIRLISDVKLWDEVGKLLSRPANEIKEQLKLISERRNKIAHEADLNPSVPGKRWPVDDKWVNEAINFIEQVVEGIHTLII
ncbi:MAG: HEPN domain-containing protein [Chloroflexota bacterium]|nr:hypothetical protein [Chloroflexota bacterium]